MSVELAPDLVEFVQRRVADGTYANGDDVVREAFKLLTIREQLITQIDAGTQQLRSGQYTDYDEDSLRHLFNEIQDRGRRLTDARKTPQ